MTIEELQEQLLKMQETINNIQDENKQLKEINEQKAKREKELEEYNQKLFLRITEKVDNKDKEIEDEIPLCMDKATFNLLNDKEKEELKDLIEEE